MYSLTTFESLQAYGERLQRQAARHQLAHSIPRTSLRTRLRKARHSA